jgi:iron complex outermembrane receptor protein
MQSINWLSIPLSDIERIEVLQGASSVQYGNNAVGGVVNIITKKAKKGTSASAGFTIGSFGENREQVGANVGGKSAGFVADAERYETDGYRDRSGYRTTNASVRGHFDPADFLTLKGGVSFGDSFYEMPGYLTKTQFKDDPTQSVNTADEATERTFLAELGAEWTPADAVSVEAPLSYSIKDIQSDMASYSAFSSREVQSVQAAPKGTWETAVGEMPLRLIAGADVSAAFLDVTTYSEKARTTKTNAFNVSQISVGPYLSARLSLLENLSLEGGARYDRSTIAATNVDKTVDDSKTHQAFVYDAGIVYRPTKDDKVYARYGTLFRYPFTDEQTSLYGFGYDAFLTGLEAEHGFNAEAGTSFSVGKILKADACAYWMELSDEIAYNYSNYRNENLDKTRRIGGDLTLQAAPAPFVSVKGTYGYVRAVFTDGANDGNRVPLVPEHRVDAAVDFKAPFGLTASPSASWRSDAYRGGDGANALEKIDSYTVYALTVRFVPMFFKGALEVIAKAENLLDLQYAPYVYYNSYYPAAGRSFSLGASYRY